MKRHVAIVSLFVVLISSVLMGCKPRVPGKYISPGKMEDILSDLEWCVLMAYLDGKSYQEIALDLDRHVKSIDNALQRVKRKLERYMDNRGDDIDISTVYRGLSCINRHLCDVDEDILPE